MTDNSVSGHYSEKKYEKISAGRREGILTLLGNVEGKEILDVGCANGALGAIVKKKFPCYITGIEISAQAGNEAMGVLDRVFVFNTEDDDAWPEELVGKTFDAIICSEVLEHLFTPESLLKHFYQMSDQKTRIVITVPNVLFWKNRLRILLGHFEYEERGLMDRGHIHFFSWTSLALLVQECGFEIVGTAHHIPTRGTRLFAHLLPGLFAQNFIIRLRRRASDEKQ